MVYEEDFPPEMLPFKDQRICTRHDQLFRDCGCVYVDDELFVLAWREIMDRWPDEGPRPDVHGWTKFEYAEDGRCTRVVPSEKMVQLLNELREPWERR
jgi:hypothetical protein